MGCIMHFITSLIIINHLAQNFTLEHFGMFFYSFIQSCKYMLASSIQQGYICKFTRLCCLNILVYQLVLKLTILCKCLQIAVYTVKR